ncbi:uncharacterized protein LOC127831609 [Dreissena polymorpha]|uniref:uncharacterized protein LOC127831609 n=1 Tax=Dreissena polymorpha TaxID=45954 RepID=UPI0022641182|nr:uncharacterized protein LOC127831609 [Dreissena polymorpha]
MLKANYGVVFFLTVLVPLALTQNCDFDAVHAKLNRCSKVELAISPSTAEAYLNERCQDVECSIRCVRDAVGNCHKSDAFFNFDPATIKVAFRMECNNSKDYVLVYNIDNSTSNAYKVPLSID